MRVKRDDLKSLITNKASKGRSERGACDVAADVLTFADERGIHSHGAMRVEYYAERIAKGGINTNPDFKFEKTGPCNWHVSWRWR